MIIKVDGKEGLVMGFDSNNMWYCSMDLTPCLKDFKPEQMEIKNHKLPPNWTITRYLYSSFREIPTEIDHAYNDYIFFCHPISISPFDLMECTYFTEFPNTGEIGIREYMMLKAMNEVREFHSWDQIDVPYIDDFENILMTPEQRRLKQIEDELNEGLKLLETEDS